MKENFIHTTIYLAHQVVVIAIKTHMARNNVSKFPCIFQINALQLSYQKWITSNYHIYPGCISLNNSTLLSTCFLPFLKSHFLATHYMSSTWISGLSQTSSLGDFVYLMRQTSNQGTKFFLFLFLFSFLSLICLIHSYHDTTSSDFHSPILGYVFHLSFAISILLHQWSS